MDLWSLIACQRYFLKALNDLLKLSGKNESLTVVLIISVKSVLADFINNIFRLLQGRIT